jgi:hypothetical protein
MPEVSSDPVDTEFRNTQSEKAIMPVVKLPMGAVENE